MEGDIQIQSPGYFPLTFSVEFLEAHSDRKYPKLVIIVGHLGEGSGWS